MNDTYHENLFQIGKVPTRGWKQMPWELGQTFNSEKLYMGWTQTRQQTDGGGRETRSLYFDKIINFLRAFRLNFIFPSEKKSALIFSRVSYAPVLNTNEPCSVSCPFPIISSLSISYSTLFHSFVFISQLCKYLCWVRIQFSSLNLAWGFFFFWSIILHDCKIQDKLHLHFTIIKMCLDYKSRR